MSEVENTSEKPERKEGSIPTASCPSSGIGPGTQIGHFRIDHELGRGGAGVVYLAHDSRLGRPVAIKMLPPEITTNIEILRRWKREARLLASLNHPNIATIHEELDESGGASYLVLEYVEGETLRERIARGELTVEEAVPIALQIAEAISAAHDKGVVHRDLKPANIKITPEGRVKVLDFGVAKMFGGQKQDQQGTIVTQPGQVIGTPGYMSPEQSLGKETDHRTDIWSFGCVLHEMLTAMRPFSGEDTSEILASMLRTEPDWKVLPVDTDAPLREILRKCLEKDPDRRYQSADELYRGLRAYQTALTKPMSRALSLRALLRRLRSLRVSIPTVLALLAVGFAVHRLVERGLNVRRARSELLPRISTLIEQDQYLEAFFLAKEAQKYIPRDPMLLRSWREITQDYTVVTIPVGADVFFRDHRAMDAKWEYLGRAPLEGLQFPQGVYRFRIIRPGFVSRECIGGPAVPPGSKLAIDLWETEGSPTGMIRIPASTANLSSFSSAGKGTAEVPAYWIDQYEVTNEQYKKFVDDDGYRKPDYWKERFIKNDRELSWEEAIREFHDATGRPGPSTWEGGTYAPGREKYPVAGVSWYEAAAYAAYAGRNLPTVYHWKRASSVNCLEAFIPFSNFGREGLTPVGANRGIGTHGLYDMAGNVREWAWNTVDDSNDFRPILGGSWLEPSHLFIQRDIASAWDRSVVNGFRCVSYPQNARGVPVELLQSCSREYATDFRKIEPVSNATREGWIKDLYSYDRSELKAVVEDVNDSSPYWRRERVTFNAAYGDERMVAYLFLPKNVRPPYQTVVYFPGWGATWRAKGDFDPGTYLWDFIIKSGRAFLYPVYKGTHERRFTEPSGPLAYRDWHIELSKDLRRSIDYLETREDISQDRLAYCGFSWGARLGPLMIALETRIKIAILVCGGFETTYEPHPTMQGPNFAPAVKIPVLMVNGSEDSIFPVETSQRPMFRALGTREEDKRHVLYPGGHGLWWLFSRQIKTDVLEWMDNYLGPVE